MRTSTFFNVLYAFFSTLSFMSLIPMMQVLFDQTKKEIQLSQLILKFGKTYQKLH
jgi:hypothetical protein